MPEEFEASVEQSYRSLIRKIEDAHMLLDYGRIRAAFELAARALRKAKPGEDPRRVSQRVIAMLVRKGYDFSLAREALEAARAAAGEE